jgi:hypothetical protein
MTFVNVTVDPQYNNMIIINRQKQMHIKIKTPVLNWYQNLNTALCV